MIFWIIFAIIFILTCVWIYTRVIKKNNKNVTMHSRCNSDSPCNGELVCDQQCNRCKKPLNGICATDVDCETGLYCVGWKCSELEKKSNKNKRVRWNESNNSVHLF